MKKLSIAVVTPSFNQGQFIEETINSILSQDVESMDYFVVDGGSTDETVLILERYKDQLRYVSEKDRGQSHAVNKGIRQASSDIIAWLNSDDIYYPGTLKTVEAFFREHPEVDILYGMADHIDVEGNFIEKYPTEEHSPDRLLLTCYFSQPAVFFRRRVVEKCGLLDEALNYCMDYEYWIRLSKEKDLKFFYLPVTLAATRLHADTKTLGSKVKVHNEINTMLKKSVGRVPDRWLFNYAHIVMDQQIDKKLRPVYFVVGVSCWSIFASLRWNRLLSSTLLKTIFQWNFGILKRKWKAQT